MTGKKLSPAPATVEAVFDPGPNIYQRMAAVLRDLPAIGKNQRNVEQNFAFRGIDDVLNALNPILADHGVFFVPDVLERVEEKRELKGGRIMHAVHLHVRYRFYGPGGDYVEASGWGEGTDMGDKATNKAMTGAMKYVLFQTFAISTKEASENDSDRSAAEETVREEPYHAVVRRAVLKAHQNPSEAQEFLKRLGIKGNLAQATKAQLDQVMDTLVTGQVPVENPPAEEGSGDDIAAPPAPASPPTPTDALGWDEPVSQAQ